MLLYNSPAQVTQGATPAQGTVSGYGGASGRGWDLGAQTGTNATCTYDNTNAIQPSGFDVKFQIGTTSAASCLVWQSSGQLFVPNPSIYFRTVLYFTANPSGTVGIMAGTNATPTKAFDVVITSSGKLEIRDSTNTVFATFTNSIPLNTRFRIEGHVTPGVGTNGQVSLSLYPTEFSTTPTETETTTATMNVLVSAFSQWRWGQAFGGSANIGPWWQGHFALSNSGPVGPGAICPQMVAGAPSQTGFTVVSKVIGGTAVRLKVATNSGLTQNVIYMGPQVPDAYGYVRHVVTGLQPYTRYYCQLADSPASQPETLFGSVGSCKTLPAAGTPANFNVSFVSCIATNDLNSPADTVAMTDWVNRQADINIFTGDLNYFDATYTDEYSAVGVHESQFWTGADQGAGVIQQMLSTAWGFYCRSDHDTGPDNGDSNTSYMPANIAAYQEVFPYAPLGDTESPPHGLYQSWVAGRVRFIMVDIRNIDRSPGANTDNGAKTMLGSTQLLWFFNQLTQPEPLKIVVGDTQWMGNVVAGQNDKWWAYNTERQAIISFIQANQAAIGNMMWWHGDFHGLGCTIGAHNTWGGFPVYCAAPMVQTGAAVQDQSTFDQYYNNGGGECRQYGRVAITDTGTVITVAFQGWDAVNQVAQIAQTDVFDTSFSAAQMNVWNGSEWVPVETLT